MTALEISSPVGAGMAPLAMYGIDPVTGFAPSEDPLDRLPAEFDAWERVVPIMAPLIRSRRLRSTLRAMPILEVANLRGEREQERALLLLTVFANAWVWGGECADLTIPATISTPLCALAGALDRPPIVHYGSMALRNWRRVDRTLPLSADNVQMAITFLGGVDEEWFFLASLGCELAGAPLLPILRDLVVASQNTDEASLTRLLDDAAQGMSPVLQALERMREWCDPYVFYNRVRNFVTGWPEPGVVYEGVWTEPRRYTGGSAGQSSLIQAIDAALGVLHDGVVTGPFFREMRTYMPREHRRFVEDLAAFSCVRDRVARGGPDLRAAYNRALDVVVRFRAAHRAMAHDYVTAPSGMVPDEKGTGGTTLAQFLDDARYETQRNAL